MSFAGSFRPSQYYEHDVWLPELIRHQGESAGIVRLLSISFSRPSEPCLPSKSAADHNASVVLKISKERLQALPIAAAKDHGAVHIVFASSGFCRFWFVTTPRRQRGFCHRGDGCRGPDFAVLHRKHATVYRTDESHWHRRRCHSLSRQNPPTRVPRRFPLRSVLVGFLSGVGVQVAVGELHDMLGIEKIGHGFFRQLLYTFEHLRDTHLPSLFIALTVLVIIALFEVVAPRFPGALLAVIGMTAASAYFHWAGRGVQVVGAVPGGLPRLGLPHLAYNDIIMVLPISLSCFIVILAQSAATSRAYALKYRDQFNQNVDLIGLSLANAAAGCSSTFVVNGSPTKTAMVDTAGGRS